MSTPESRTYTVISCHYGDLFWIRHMLGQLEKHSRGLIKEIVLVDQSRSMHDELASLPGVTRVLEFEPDADQMAVEGHDHPASLDRALAATQFATSHVIVMDSDAFPVRDGWLDYVDDISLALVPGSTSSTHPCLMIFPSRCASLVSFSEGFLERATRKGAPDTGRRVGVQLAQSGEDVTLLKAEPAFNGYRGSFYLHGAYYHHGHGSFLAGDHDQYKGFVSEASEMLYRRRVLQGRFTLTPLDISGLFIRYVWRRLRNRVYFLLRGPSHIPK